MGKIENIVKKHQEGAILNLFVTPGTRDIVFPAGVNNWRRCIEIQLSAPAKDNKANKEVIKTLASYFEMPVNNVFIIKGEKNREKTILVKGVSVNFVSNRLRESLDGL